LHLRSHRVEHRRFFFERQQTVRLFGVEQLRHLLDQFGTLELFFGDEQDRLLVLNETGGGAARTTTTTTLL
jgi:hypothetical protein